ncbi:MAG: hypothetical protein QOD99_3092 [Chthoniobacter sp.]|jgi:hypothetical protein|nr:hypothetical protein [Chthoniobacter sp.]
MKLGLLLLSLFAASLAFADEEFADASLIQLLATPEKFNGKRVRVSGYLRVEFEGNALYLSKDAADNIISEHALWTDYAEHPSLEPATRPKGKQPKLADFDARFVLIEGTFDATRRGHMGEFSGTIRDITRVMELIRYYDGRIHLRK